MARAWAYLAFGVVLMLTSRRSEDLGGFVLVGMAMVVPSVVWLVSDRWFGKPRGAWWWIIVGSALAVAFWGLVQFPVRNW